MPSRKRKQSETEDAGGAPALKKGRPLTSISKMTVAQLKQELQRRQLDDKGLRGVLLKRLQDDEQARGAAEDTAPVADEPPTIAPVDETVQTADDEAAAHHRPPTEQMHTTIGKMTVAQLRKELKHRNLNDKGLRAVLVKRLQDDEQAQSIEAGTGAPATTASASGNAVPSATHPPPAPTVKQEQPIAASADDARMEEAPALKLEEPIVKREAVDVDLSAAATVHAFRTLYGATGNGPVCYLLETGGIKILLDCGWDEKFDLETIEPLRAVAPSVQLVLVSHSDLEHCGALPYACANFGLACPIYCTEPTQKFGELTVVDALFNRGWTGRGPAIPSMSEHRLFTVEQVEHTFRTLMTPLSFTQVRTVKAAGDVGSSQRQSVTITPFAAGHTLGGAMWRISKTIESILYAVDFNHTNERHLPPTALGEAGLFDRPAVMIAGVRHAATGREKVPKRATLEAEIIATALDTLRGGGDVLFPVDGAARLLELLLMFEQSWAKERGQIKASYRVALVHHVGFNVVEFANLLLTWMSDSVTAQFDQNRTKAFDFKYIEITKSVADLNKKDDSRPKVVFATSEALDYGNAHDLLGEVFAPNPKSIVVLTSPPRDGTVGAMLLAHHRAGTKSAWTLPFERHTREHISGAVLEEWEALKKKNAEAEAQANAEALSIESQLLEFSAVGDANEDLNTMAEKDLSKADQGTGDATSQSIVAAALALEDQFDSGGLAAGLYSEPLHPMFDFTPPKQEYDAYGEVLGADELKHYEQKFKPGRVLLDGLDEKGRTQADADELGVQSRTDDGQSDEDDGLDEEREAELLDRPTIMTSEAVVDFEVHCSIAYMPMHGVADHRSCGVLIKKVAPKHLIAVGGDPAGLVKATGRQRDKVHTSIPECGEDVIVQADTKYFKTVVDDSLLRDMHISPLGSYEVGILNAQYGEAGVMTLVPFKEDDGISAATGDDEIKGGIDWDKINRPVTIVGVGDLRLLDLKKGLNKIGLQAEMKEGGRLLTENGVSITKEGPNDYFVEGPMCDVYYKARDILYKQFAFV
jgi:cleavage and polyadenylation specificity factor subunit 2